MNLLEARAFEQTRELVSGALKNKLNPSPGDRGPYGPYVSQTFSDKIVYEWDSKMWECSYDIQVADGISTCTLGTPIQVVITYAPISESAADVEEADIVEPFVALLERSIKNGTTQIKLIQPGWGSTGYYPAAMLERDGPQVFKSGTKMYWDHPTVSEAAARPERSLRDLAAVTTSDAVWQAKGPSGPGLYANAKIFESFAPVINEMAPHIGVSIRAAGTAKAGEAEGRKGRIIESIAVGKSVDFVTEPGAGGRIVQLFESVRPSAGDPKEDDVDAEEFKKLQESVTTMQASMTTLQESLGTVTQERDRLLEGQLLSEAAGLIATQINASVLPPVTKLRLIENLRPKAPIKDGKVDTDALKTMVEAAVKDETEYLSKVTGSPIRGMGTSTGEVDPEESKTPKDLDKTFQRLGMSESGSAIAAAGRF